MLLRGATIHRPTPFSFGPEPPEFPGKKKDSRESQNPGFPSGAARVSRKKKKDSRESQNPGFPSGFADSLAPLVGGSPRLTIQSGSGGLWPLPIAQRAVAADWVVSRLTVGILARLTCAPVHL